MNEMANHEYLVMFDSGLDRSWEVHRLEGMEMLHHSVGILKERQSRQQRQPSLPDRSTHAVTRNRSKSRSDGNHCHNQTAAEPFNLPVAALLVVYSVRECCIFFCASWICRSVGNVTRMHRFVTVGGGGITKAISSQGFGY